MKRRMLVAGCALAVLAALGLAGSAAAGEQVPFNGTLEGFDGLVVAPPPIAVVHGVGGGEATQLGRYTYEFDATVDFSMPPPKGVGTLVLTAANGDMLILGVIGTSKPVIPGVLVEVVEVAIIVDGTGRFAGATGGFTLTRLVHQESRLTIGSFEGTISSPGADNP